MEVSKQDRIFYPVVLILLTLLVFSQVWSFEFIQMDDYLHIVDNPHLKYLNFSSIKFFWTQPFQGLYIPLTYSMWSLLTALTRHFFGEGPLNPFFFHSANALLHTLNGLWVFHIFRLKSKPLPAFLGAVFFAIHPLQAESVAWASGMKDILSHFFALGATYYYLSFSLNQKKSRYLFALALFLLGLLAKPSVVVLPAFLFFYEMAFFQGGLKRLPRLIPWFIATLPFLWITKAAQPNLLMRYITPSWGRPVIMADSLLFYLSKILFPVLLGPDYARTPEAVLHHVWGYLSGFILFVVAGCLIKKDSRNKWVLVLFIVGLFPVLGLVPFFYQFFSTVADRYLYFILIVPALVVTWIWQEQRPATRVLLLGILFFLTLLSHRQVSVWIDDEALFRHLVRVNPHSRIGHNNLGTILERKNQIDEAGYHYRETLRLDPESVQAIYNLGRVCGRQRNYIESVELLESLLKLNPAITEAHYTLGIVYRELRNWERSINHLSYATQLEPTLARAHLQLALTFKARGSFNAAHHSLLRAASLEPQNLHVQCALADTLVDLKQENTAKEILSQIEASDPNNACLSQIRSRTETVHS